MLRSLARFAWIYALWLSGVLWFCKRSLRRRGAAVVLTFHRVLDDGEFAASSSLPGILVRRGTFEDFLEWASRHCEILDLAQGAPDWSRPASRPRIALTFDDGWLDNHRFAAPAAARFGASMTIFICPGLTGQRYPFWPERVTRLLRGGRGPEGDSLEATIEELKRMDPDTRRAWIDHLEQSSGREAARAAEEPSNGTMDWREVRDLEERGVRFGSHTMNHVILTQVPASCAEQELRESRVAIEGKLGAACGMFAYPNGNCDAEVKQAVAKSDYRLAFTTRPGEWLPQTDPLLIPRMNVSEKHLAGPHGRFSPAVFEYTVFWKASRG